VITKHNLIHLIESLKEVEADQIADSYDCIANSLGLYGLKTNLNGKQYFERNYEQ
jgi:FPC/CPF motif-containing protein YcgG